MESPRTGAVHTRSFLENFIKIGGEAFFIREKGKKRINKKRINDIRIYNIRWVDGIPELPGSSLISNLLFNLRLYQAGSSIIRTEKPDIIHERELFLKFPGLLLANKFEIPYILEVNAPMLYEDGRGYSRIHQEIGKIIEEKLFNGANRIIVVSNILKNYLLKQGVPEEKIRVVPNGVDENVFNPDVAGESVRKKYHLEDKEVICFAGSLHLGWQGIGDLLKAARIISSIKASVRFLIAGNTERQEEMLKSAPDNVIFTGQIEHIKMPSYFAAADVLVAPYKQQTDFEYVNFYGSSLKLFEYMAMGKPIITTNLGQIGEIIEHGKSGLLIEPGNYKELANNILTLMADEKLRKNLGENARIEVEKNYTWERNAIKIMEIYKEVLGVKKLYIYQSEKSKRQSD